MTQDSRAAYATWIISDKARYNTEPKVIFNAGWQASEQRILELLGSDEMVGVVAKVMCFNRDPLDTDNYKLWYDEAQAALAAIKQKVML